MKTTRLDTSNEMSEATTIPSPTSWPTELPTRPGTTTEIEDLVTLQTTTIAPKANRTTTTTTTTVINTCTVDTNCAPNEHCKLGRCQKKGIHIEKVVYTYIGYAVTLGTQNVENQ